MKESAESIKYYFGDVQDGNAWFYFNYDMRGSTTVVLTPTGSYKKDYEYDTFGNTTEGEGSFYNETRFTGATHDKSTGMHYLNARYYNPSTGRFLTQDSYTGNPYDPWTQNLYAYCGNNPVNFVDPTGHFFNFLAAGIGAVVGAVAGAAITFVSDLIDDGEINTPVETYLGNTAGAAVTGLAAGFTCGASLALEGGGLALYTAGAYGLSSMAGSTARQAIATGEVDPTQVAIDGAVGAVTAGTLKYASDKLSTANFGFKAYKGAGKAGQGFKTFKDFKKAFGSAGEGKQWHHIVEQSQIKKSGFDPTKIHNTNNIIAIDKATHSKISGSYTTRNYFFTDGLSVRDWLAGQSYKTQYNYGISILKKFGVTR